MSNMSAATRWLADLRFFTIPLMRLFIGVPLARAVIDDLSALVARLRSRANSLRWTAPPSWHVTLQFLGNSTSEQLACLEKHLAEIHHAPLSIQLPGLGFFDRAGVFYASVQLSSGLESLQQKVLQHQSQTLLSRVRRHMPSSAVGASSPGSEPGRDASALRLRRAACAQIVLAVSSGAPCLDAPAGFTAAASKLSGFSGATCG